MLAPRRDYSPHSMRATFITRTPENGAAVDDVQKATVRRDPIATRLYGLRGYNPEQPVSSFAT
jgi:hypothetical protein